MPSVPFGMRLTILPTVLAVWKVAARRRGYTRSLAVVPRLLSSLDRLRFDPLRTRGLHPGL